MAEDSVVYVGTTWLLVGASLLAFMYAGNAIEDSMRRSQTGREIDAGARRPDDEPRRNEGIGMTVGAVLYFAVLILNRVFAP